MGSSSESLIAAVCGKGRAGERGGTAFNAPHRILDPAMKGCADARAKHARINVNSEVLYVPTGLSFYKKSDGGREKWEGRAPHAYLPDPLKMVL